VPVPAPLPLRGGVTVSGADPEDARIELDRDLMIKDGWPCGVAERMALRHARERAAAAAGRERRDRERRLGRRR